MQQVLFYIPVRAGWLPDFLPLPLLVFLFFLLVAGGLWFAARYQPFQIAAATWQSFAQWLAGFGTMVGVGMYVISRWWPDGIPVNGFGMMLFVAFILCNGVAGRLAVSTRFLTIATGPKRGQDYLAETYPAEERHRRAQDMIQDTSVVLFIGGLLGARITYLLKDENAKINSVWDFVVQLPMIWEGGIIFYGSVIGGTIAYAACYAYLYYFRNIRVSTLKLADIAAPCLALGLCLGRIGCLLNGCCYGQVACADCAVVPVHFPLSAPARPYLVAAGYQTAAGFTLADERAQPPQYGVHVGQVVPHSPAANAGLQAGAFLVEANGKELKRGTKIINKGTPKERELLVSPVESLEFMLGSEWPRGAKMLTLVTLDPPDPETGKSGERHTHTFTPYTIGLHPTQVYESISMFLLFGMLLAFMPLQWRDGQVMAILMVCYGIHRSLNELLRNDPRPEGLEKYASIALIVLGLVLFAVLCLRPAPRKAEG